ncbi:MAG: D-2-hydroxyacid dehydrogenase [Candidatus Cryptobacteroides sp.]
MKIVFLDAATMGDVDFSPVRALGDLVLYESSSREEALERVAEAEVLIINKIRVNAELMDAAPSLKLICEAATGVNNIDVAEAERRGIPVRNVAGYSTDSVVQTTFMLMLALVGKAAYFDNFVKSGEYSRCGMFTNVSTVFMELAGKRLGIIGMGNIGRKVAAVAEAFGMEVVYYSTSGTSHCTDYPSLGLEELLQTSDVVSVHAPYNERTAGLIREVELGMMKPGAYLLNLGRGGIVDETALAEAIDGGLIAGAASDVFTSEPLPADNPLMKVQKKDRLLLTPHIAWASKEARDRLAAMIARNIAEGW